VLICDYSYKKEVIEDLLKRVKNLLIIDHHKTAEKDLAEIDDRYKIFDMKHSGAYLTWTYLFGDSVPLLIRYIEDRDIWTKKMPFTEEFFSWFSTLPFRFDVYDQYLDDEKLIEMIKTRGPVFAELNEYYVKKRAPGAAIKFCEIKKKFYLVAYANTYELKSDIGNRILSEYPLIDFSVVYSINDYTDSTAFSLRSTDQHVDVSEISTLMGGGGHRNASAVYLNLVSNILPSVVIGKDEFYHMMFNIYEKEHTIGEKRYRCVYLHSPKNKRKLGSYLLQNKYVNSEKVSVQVASEIFRQTRCPSLFSEEKRYLLAIVWKYNPMLDQTKFHVSFDTTITSDETKEVGKLLELNEYDEVVQDGFKKAII
jgi:uncharacterized protein